MIHHNRRGFTLIEISIALVIIGLIVGGIIVGKDMIRAAEIRSTLSQIEAINRAVFTFRDKFMALPGDWPDAMQFFGALDPDPDVCLTIPPSGNATCDGNGNGQLKVPEHIVFWQHLALTGFPFVNRKIPAYGLAGCSEEGVDRTQCALKMQLPNTFMQVFYHNGGLHHKPMRQILL